MYGEVTETIAEAIADSPAARFLLGIKQPHVELIGIKEKASLNDLLAELINKLDLYIKDNE